jgi:beta-glucosidase/6-phospho-beta-glucosidase/beta-galactosidase
MSYRAFFAAPIALATLGCSSESPAPPSGPAEIVFPALGSASAPAGKGGFRFGAASAATQIEDNDKATDWYLWTAPAPDGLAKSTFVGDAVKGYSMSIEDVDLIAAMHLDSYRFSIEWARVEPKKDMIDEAALDHYGKLIDALVAKHIRPMITIHHFSNPVWVDDPRDAGCKNGPSDTNLCGLDNPVGAPLVIAQAAEHAKLLAKRFGDRVDDWGTVNEPVNYLLAAYGAGQYPPGKFDILMVDKFAGAIKSYIGMHAAIYKAIKEADTVDADGDGVAASVGFTHGAQEWVPARGGKLSDRADDIAARDRLLWLYEYLFVESIRQGQFDANLDGKMDEPHPEWKGTLDWLGVQYYFRGGVTADPALIPGFDLTACFGGYDAGSCVAPIDPTYYVPVMKYEHHPEGLYTILKDFGARWPDLPLMVTESGIATRVGARRAEMIVRALEAVNKARAEGVDVRGYYHWSIYDNFEWALGFTPQFGLYSVDRTTFARTPTEGATVFGAISGAHKLTADQRTKYGGDGAMTAEPATP